MIRYPRLLIVLALTVLALVFGLSPAGAQDAVPRFEPSSCTFPLPSSQNPECGMLIVPENRTVNNGKTIKIAVAIIRSVNPSKAPEPIIYLEGGPGASSLKTISLQYDTVFKPFADQYDVILFDQRGIGLSEPALECPEVVDYNLSTLDVQTSVGDFVTGYTGAMETCGERLASSGIDLSAYNSTENAADVNDLRTVLGYDKVNLYGTSYGTKLALTVMRDHPEGVRSVILDSVYPPQVSILDSAKTAERSLNELFTSCAADTECNTAYPELEKVFYDLVNQLNAEPVHIQIPDTSTGQILDGVIDGDSFVGLVFQALYVADFIPMLPMQIYNVKNGEYGILTTLATLQVLQFNFISIGMNNAVQCKEEYPFDNAQSIKTILQNTRPELRGFARRSMIEPAALDVCAAWKEGEVDPVDNKPVYSDIPTLVLSGQFDPITPPDYGRLAASTLSHGYFFEFSGVGHGVIISDDCAYSMARAFLSDPNTTPDAACMAQRSAIVFSNANAPVDANVTLVPFTNSILGITGVIPDGWKEVAAGTYARAATQIDQVAVAFQAVAGGTMQLFVPLLSNRFGVTDTTPVIREANGLSWNLLKGSFAGSFVDLAMAEANGKVYLIIFSTNNEAEQAAFYDTVFIPVVDAARPA